MEASMGMMSSLATSRKALYAGAIAASMFVAAGAGITGPAHAQEPIMVNATQEVTATTDCKTYRPGEGGQSAVCEVLKGKALDAQIDALDAKIACAKKVKEAFDIGKVTRETVKAYGKERICELANTLG